MPLTGNYSDDEKGLREALGAKVIAILAHAPFDFPAGSIQTRRRYVRDNDKWEALFLITDPDAADANDPAAPRTMRLVSVETQSSDLNRARREWLITFAVKVGVGFKDERPDPALLPSYDYLMRAVFTVFEQVLEDPSIGFDDSLTFYRARLVGSPRVVPQDKQGNAAQVADCELFAVITLN